MSVRVALTLACVFVVALALPAGAQMAMAPGRGGGMMGSGSMPGMGGGMMSPGMGGGMGGQTQTYDLAKAKRLMAEAADLIENGKTQYAAGQYREARRLFKNAKEKLDEVRGNNQQGGMGMGGGMGMSSGMGGAPMMGSSGGPMMTGSSGGPMMGGSGGSMMMGGEGGPMMGGGAGGMGGGFSTGLIPPEKDDLVVQARIMWMTAVAWWGKSWGAIATTELVPDRVLLGPWTSGAGNQMGGMAGGPMGMSGGSGGPGGMMPMMGGPGGK